jgi:hypothetical protein
VMREMRVELDLIKGEVGSVEVFPPKRAFTDSRGNRHRHLRYLDHSPPYQGRVACGQSSVLVFEWERCAIDQELAWRAPVYTADKSWKKLKLGVSIPSNPVVTLDGALVSLLRCGDFSAVEQGFTR